MDFIKIKNSIQKTQNEKTSHRLGEKYLENISDKRLWEYLKTSQINSKKTSQQKFGQKT